MQLRSNSQTSPKIQRLVVSAMALGILVVACGVDRKPHYPDKRFGQGSDTTDGRSDDISTGDDESSTPQDQTLLHQQFFGYFDLNSVRAIYHGVDPNNGQVSEGGVTDGLIATAISFMFKEDSKEVLQMLVKQQSKTNNLVIQDVQTDGGDAIASVKGEDTQSGSQILDWALVSDDKTAGNSCPKPFVCIKRMVWKPTQGKPMTYCYRDYQTKKPITIPYSANSNFTREAYEAAIGTGLTSSPIEVTSHPGDVACDDPEIVTQDVNAVTYKVTIGDLASQQAPDFIRRAKKDPLTAETEVVIEYRLHDMTRGEPYLPKRGPFIDQLTRLNSKTKYFLNNKEHVIVKIERTVMSPFKFGTASTAQFLRDAYGATVGNGFAAIMGPENDIEGVQVNYSFEFCTHLGVVRNPIDHCVGQPAP